jgi:hypothetical protein
MTKKKNCFYSPELISKGSFAVLIRIHKKFWIPHGIFAASSFEEIA